MSKRAWALPLCAACILLACVGWDGYMMTGFSPRNTGRLLAVISSLYALGLAILAYYAVRSAIISIIKGNLWGTHVDGISTALLIITVPIFAWTAFGGDVGAFLASPLFFVPLLAIGFLFLGWSTGLAGTFYVFFLPASLLIPFIAICIACLSAGTLIVGGIPTISRVPYIILAGVLATAGMGRLTRWPDRLRLLTAPSPVRGRIRALSSLGASTGLIIAGALVLCLAVRRIWDIRIHAYESGMKAQGAPTRLIDFKQERFAAGDAHPALTNALIQMSSCDRPLHVIGICRDAVRRSEWNSRFSRALDEGLSHWQWLTDYIYREMTPVIGAASTWLPQGHDADLRHDWDHVPVYHVINAARTYQLLAYQHALKGETGKAWEDVRRAVKVANLTARLNNSYKIWLVYTCQGGVAFTSADLLLKSEAPRLPADIAAELRGWALAPQAGRFLEYICALVLERRAQDRAQLVWRAPAGYAGGHFPRFFVWQMAFWNLTGLFDASAFEVVKGLRNKSRRPEKIVQNWRFSPFSREYSDYPLIYDDERKLQARLRLVLACGALKEYRRRHGEYPDKLDALTPPYLTADLLKDPYGGDLGYTREPRNGGYHISSRGRDGRGQVDDNYLLKIDEPDKIAFPSKYNDDALYKKMGEGLVPWIKSKKLAGLRVTGLNCALSDGRHPFPGYTWADGAKSKGDYAVWEGAKFAWQDGKGIMQYSATGNTGCGIAIKAPAGKPANVAGARMLVLKLRVPPDVFFRVRLDEDGYVKKPGGKIAGARGSDGEQYESAEVLGSGRTGDYRFWLVNMCRSNSGNQQGNGRLDTTALSAVEIEIGGREAPGTIEVRSIRFE